MELYSLKYTAISEFELQQAKLFLTCYFCPFAAWIWHGIPGSVIKTSSDKGLICPNAEASSDHDIL